MSSAAQQRAIKAYRARLTQRGLKRFEVMALDTDRELIRGLAKHLAEGGPAADEVRAAVKSAIASEAPTGGGILAALRRSPLVGAELETTRSDETGRRVDL